MRVARKGGRHKIIVGEGKGQYQRIFTDERQRGLNGIVEFGVDTDRGDSRNGKAHGKEFHKLHGHAAPAQNDKTLVENEIDGVKILFCVDLRKI